MTFPEKDICFSLLRFGIMTPIALERTTLEKNRCPDAGAVIDGILLYVKNDSAAARLVSLRRSQAFRRPQIRTHARSFFYDFILDLGLVQNRA
jgi:hypothetical protein